MIYYTFYLNSFIYLNLVIGKNLKEIYVRLKVYNYN